MEAEEGMELGWLTPLSCKGLLENMAVEGMEELLHHPVGSLPTRESVAWQECWSVDDQLRDLEEAAWLWQVSHQP